MDPRSIPVRFSHLKRIGNSPAHYFESITAARKDTLSFRLGRGAHRLIYGLPVDVYTERRAGKAWDEYRETRNPDNIFNEREYDIALGMSRSLKAHREAPRLLEGMNEQTLSWQLQGRDCQGTPDTLGEHLVDLKTTKCAHPERFKWDARNYAYHAQLAWYRDGVRLSGAGTPREAYLIAVESTPPYPVTVLRLTEAKLETGARLCRTWFEQLLVCEASNHWPGYSEAILDWDDDERDDVPLTVGGEELDP